MGIVKKTAEEFIEDIIVPIEDNVVDSGKLYFFIKSKPNNIYESHKDTYCDENGNMIKSPYYTIYDEEGDSAYKPEYLSYPKSLLKKSLFKNNFLRKWDTVAAKWPLLHTGSQNIAVYWPKVGRRRKAIFRVGGFSKHS